MPGETGSPNGLGDMPSDFASTGNTVVRSQSTDSVNSIDTVIRHIPDEQLSDLQHLKGTKRPGSASPEPQPKRLKTLNAVPKHSYTRSSTATSSTLTLNSSQDDCKKEYHLAKYPNLRKCMQARQLPWLIQYELARLLSQGTLKESDVLIKDLDEVQSCLKASWIQPGLSRTAELLLRPVPFLFASRNTKSYESGRVAFAQEAATKSPWNAMQGEEQTERENKKAATYDGVQRYEGRVCFRLKLEKVREEFKYTLEAPELGSTYEFSRLFGSKAVLRCKVDKKLLGCSKKWDELRKFLHRPITLYEKVYRAFYAKDQNVYFWETNEVYEGGALNSSDHGMGLCQFLNWYNPININSDQAMAKWASRFALGLSSSVPGIEIDPPNVTLLGDVIAIDGNGRKVDMSDGAGLINKAGLRSLAKTCGWHDTPTAVQVRVLGSKGLLVLDPTCTDETPKIWLRRSQVKINYNDATPERSRYTIHALRASHTRTPCSLSTEVIINLASNGVPASAFIDLLRKGLQQQVTQFLRWDDPEAINRLIWAVSKAGNIFAARRARADPGRARVQGYRQKTAEELWDEEEDETGESTAWWGDDISGCPSTLEETIVCLLEGGFMPKTCRILQEKLKKMILTMVIPRWTKRYQIEVPMSFSAFLVPDPKNVLEPGQIYFRSSRIHLPMPNGGMSNTLTGPVLVTRHPCKLPTDVRKWEAVNKPELDEYLDVIVCSVKGDRRAADWLGGGDYDGDKGLVIYQPEIVNDFNNALEQLANPPLDFIRKNFNRSNVTVEEFLQKTEGQSEVVCIEEYQRHLLRALEDISAVGQYSKFHDYAIYTFGYTHPKTLRLAHMFCHVLDGAKTGLKVYQGVLTQDRKDCDQMIPQWVKWKKEGKDSDRQWEGQPIVFRAKGTGFIMDALMDACKEEDEKMRTTVDQVFDAIESRAMDRHLSVGWQELEEKLQNSMNSKKAWCNDLKTEMNLIKAHVEDIYTEHRDQMAKCTGRSSVDITKRQDILRDLSKKFASGPPDSELELVSLCPSTLSELKASYAYIYAHTEHNYRFPFDVAMRDLCLIKAKKLGFRVVVEGAYNNLKPQQPRESL